LIKEAQTMAIVTRDEVKLYLQISTTTFDSLIDALIPQAEGLFLQVRGIDFFTFTGDITNTSNEITDIDEFTYVKAGKIIEDLKGGLRELITLVEEEDDKITIENAATYSSDDAELTIYPYGSQLVASKIVGYFLSKSSANGLKQESIGTYDYTKFDNKTGLPTDIVAMIEQFQRGYC